MESLCVPHGSPGQGRQSIKGHWFLFEGGPRAPAWVNLRGSACVHFPHVHINLEEQHLAKSGYQATDPQSSLSLPDTKPNLSASPRRLHCSGSLKPLSITHRFNSRTWRGPGPLQQVSQSTYWDQNDKVPRSNRMQ